jgi:hypothetical protein
MKSFCIFSAAVLAISAQAEGATLVGAYGFDGTFESSQPGGATLGLIDPTGTSAFGTDTVFGETRSVFNFNGTSANEDQSGLTLSSAGLTADSYSIALTFKFNERQGAWRRIFDVSGRSLDSGFYVDPSNNLAVYPTSGSNVAFDSGVYRNVVLTVSGSTVAAYIDGGQSFSTTSSVLTIGDDPLVFFADNILAGGQQEWSSGSIAALRVFDGVLTAEEIATLNGDPFVEPPVPGVPEPASWAMMIAGFGLIGEAMRRRSVKVRFAA